MSIRTEARSRLFGVSAFALVASFCATAATAETAPAAATEQKTEPAAKTDIAEGSDIVVTATRVAQPAAEVGQAVTVVTRDEIDRRQTVSVADLLSTTPGVTVTRNGSLGGFTGVLERYTYPKLFNLYLDPKEQHNYLTRKLAYIEAFQLGMRSHLATFKKFPAKKVMGIKVADKRE